VALVTQPVPSLALWAMARNDAWRRYLDTGAAFVALSRSRAETIVKDLVKTG